jgi:hypothetical protein
MITGRIHWGKGYLTTFSYRMSVIVPFLEIIAPV